MNEPEHGIQIKLNKETRMYILLLDGKPIHGEFNRIQDAWDEGNAMLERLIQKEREKHHEEIRK